MKKFKLLAGILAFVIMLTALTGCGGNADANDAQGNNMSTNVTQDNNAGTQGTVNNEENNTITASEKDFFNDTIASLIDTSKYEYKDWSLEEGYGNSVEYSLESDYAEQYNFDYLIKFADNSEIKLPVTYSEMENLKWNTETAADKQVSNKVQTGVYFTNGTGEKIILWTQNLVDGDEAYANLSDCKFFTIELDARYVSKYTICGTITESSTMSDIIRALGNPTTIDYDWDDNEIKLYYHEQLNNGYSSISVYLDGKGTTISSIKYQYSPSDV